MPLWPIMAKNLTASLYKEDMHLFSASIHRGSVKQVLYMSKDTLLLSFYAVSLFKSVGPQNCMTMVAMGNRN